MFIYLGVEENFLFFFADIDECSGDSYICSNGRCENFMGGYECICDPGFKENPLRTSCVGRHSVQ